MTFTNRMKGLFKKEGRSAAVLAIVLAIVVLLNAVVYVLGSKLNWYISSSEEEDFSLSSAAVELTAKLQNAGKRVTVAFCSSESDWESSETGAYILKTAKEYEANFPDTVDVTFWNIYTKRDAQGDRFDPTAYAKDDNGEAISLATSSVVLLSGFKGDADFGASCKVIPDHSDFYTLDGSTILAYNGEEVLGAMMLWVLSSDHKTAYFTTGHNEKFTLPFVNLLASAGYRVNAVDLKTSEIPADASLLIVCGPESDFERAAAGSGMRTEIERMTDFVSGGGNLLVLTHAYTAKRLSVFENFLSEYGISYVKGDVSGTAVNGMVKDTENAITTDGYTLVPNFALSEGADRVKTDVLLYHTSATSGVLLTEVAALTLTGDAKPLLVTTAEATLAADGEVFNTDGNYTVAAYAETAGGAVVVIPSFYLGATDALLSDGYANRDFIYSVLGEFFDANAKPLGMKNIIIDNETLENLTMGKATRITVLLLAIPVVLAGAGVYVCLRRKRR